MREDFIETAAGKLWYSVYGEEKKGVPLLVVHGGPGFVSMPQTVSDFAKERPVYFYDQLGCGNSDRAKDNNYYSVENYVNELEEVRGKLNTLFPYTTLFRSGRPSPVCADTGTTGEGLPDRKSVV